MKKIIIGTIIGISFLLESCGMGQIKIEADSFRNTRIITMSDLYPVLCEREFLEAKLFCNAYYSCEKGKGGNNQVHLRFIVEADDDFGNLRKDIIIRAGGKDYPVKLDAGVSTFQSHTCTQTNYAYSSSGRSGRSGNQGNTRNIGTGKNVTYSIRFKHLEGECVLPDTVIKSILSSQKVQVRLYAGPKPLTIMIIDSVSSDGRSMGANLGNLKKFLRKVRSV